MLQFIRKKYQKYRVKQNVNRAIQSGLKVGSGFICGGRVEFGSEPYLIEIGSHVQLSGHVLFITHDGGTWVFRDRIGHLKNITKYGPIRIYDNCFIGNRAIIMPGVKIGPSSVVGAGSVVTKNVPKETIAVGNPAKPIMTYGQYIDKCTQINQKVDPQNKKEILLHMFKNHFA